MGPYQLSKFQLFMWWLTELGGQFKPFTQDEIPQTKRESPKVWPAAHVPRYLPLNPEHYGQDGHGTIHRRGAKRDRTISARQWKKQRAYSRRESAFVIV